MAEREDADLIPVALLNPGLFERLRGYSLKTTLLEHTGQPVLVVYHDGSTCRANPREPSNRQELSPVVLAGLFTAQPADFGLQLADSLFGGDAGVGFLVKR